MGMFDIFAISGSGVTLHRQWLDAISDNIANINDVQPTSGPAFQARYVVATAVDPASNGIGGVQESGVVLGSAQGRLTYDPKNPLADKQGMVRRPDIDLGDQMSDLIMAERGYQANLAVVQRATDAYQAALQLGKSS